MSGLLSTIFDGGDGGSAQGTGGPAGDDESPAMAGGDQSQTDQHRTAADAHAAPHLTADPHVHVATGGAYATPDGATHEWSQSDDIGVHLDVSATIAATTALADEAAG